MLKYGFLLCVMCYLSCRDHSGVIRPHSHGIPHVSEMNVSHENPFRDRKAVIPPSLRRKINAARCFDELFEIKKIIQLELTDVSRLNTVVTCKVFDDCLCITDSRNSAYVLKFDLEGRFLQTIGSLGQGPGEYEFGVYLLFGYGKDKLAVTTVVGKELMVYDKEGRFIRSIPYLLQKTPVAYSRVIVSKDESRMYGIDWSGPANQDDYPLSLVFDLKANKILYGFGERTPEPSHRYGRSINGFDLVGNTLWIGGGWRDTIRIFNLDGVQLGQLDGYMPNSLTVEDWPEDFELPMAAFQQDKPERIYHFGDVVFVMGKLSELDLYYRIYDFNGHLLRKQIQFGERGIPVDYMGNTMVQAFKYDPEKHYSPELLEKLEEAGLQKEDTDTENNPFLIFSEFAGIVE